MAAPPVALPAMPDPRSPLATAFPILSIIVCLLCIPALVTHIMGRNFAASVLMISIIVPNIFNIINPLLWPTEFPGVWWNGCGLCDVEIKLEIASSGANVGAVACIFRQLAIILNTNRTTLTPSAGQRRRKWMFEIGLCAVVPCYLMIAHYFVQPFRYYIFSVQGCTPSFDNSWVSVVLVFIWPLLLCVIATFYGVLAVWRLVKYRRQFAAILSSSKSSMTRSRFVRLFALSSTLMVLYLPLAIFTFRQNTSFARHPYSWKAVHPTNWSEKIVKVAGQANGSFDRWVQIGTGFLAFPFFGLGQDAKALYRGWLVKLGIERFAKPRTNSSGQTPLVCTVEEARFDAERRERSLSRHSPITDTSITLHKDEPLEKGSPSDVAGSKVHSGRTISPAIHAGPRRPFEETLITSSPRNKPSFKIWSDAESDSPTCNGNLFEIKNGIELAKRMVHQQL